MALNVINYQKELEKILSKPENKGKKLLLHSCCAPCSSYVLTYLSSFFDITVFYYNPNITFRDEYLYRVSEQIRLIKELNKEPVTDRIPIKIIEGDYNTDEYYEVCRGLEKEKEGGSRCVECFKLRLSKTLECAIKEKADFFGTTLTISPLKNARLINEIGMEIYENISKNDYNAPMWMPSDFKKKEGYKQSIELSKKYDLYRQDYCGCEFSKIERKESI